MICFLALYRTSHKSALNFFIYGMSHLPNCKNSCRISWGPFFSLSRSWSLLALSCSTNSLRDKLFHISVMVFVVIVGTFCTTASQLSSYIQTSPTFTLQITKFRFFLLFSFILCTSPVKVSIQININKLVKTYNATPDRESTGAPISGNLSP